MMAHQLGGYDFVRMIVENTLTCYEGDVSELHNFGYGCGKCPSCLLRKKGYEEYLKEQF